MLKKCIALLLLLAFLVMTFSRAVIVVDFYANQAYIAKNLCENRDKPMMHCCGKCQLHKRLAKEDNKDKDAPERKSENRNEVLFCQKNTQGIAAPYIHLNNAAYPAFASGSPIDRASSFFHPPSPQMI